jgi:hypothetical protein
MGLKTGLFYQVSLLIVAFVMATPTVLLAEFACGAEVSYKWAKGGAGTAAGAPTAPAGATVAPSAGAGAAQPSIVRFSAIERTGTDEAAAKASLQAEVNRQKVRASESCKRDHEGYGACVATKLSVQSSTLNSLSFSVRNEVEKAIIEECREQQGACVSVESSEPVCKEVVAVAASAAGDAKKGDGKKADGKKK